jgi:hypothetical protein
MLSALDISSAIIVSAGSLASSALSQAANASGAASRIM